MQSNKDKLLQLINRFFSGKASSEEIKTLVNFFFSHQKINSWPNNFEAKKTVEGRIYNNVESNLKIGKYKENPPIPLYKRNFFKYAAAVLILVSIGYFTVLNNRENTSVNPPIVNNNIKAGTDKATLTLEDGTEVALVKGEEYNSDHVESNGKDLIYRSSNTTKKEIAYNMLTIPRGGQYHVVLSDGTQVWLNSDSKLRYPVNFIDGDTRSVELVYGEAYFDVSHSTEHQGSKFKVLSQNQEIEVLGTEFNVSAYKDETNSYTTLVNGKIVLTHDENSTILKPNQQAIIKPNDNEIHVIETDVYTVTSWRKGIFSFKNLPLENIMKTLSRWYDVDIKFSNTMLKSEHFTGVLRKNQNIEEILQIIETINNISYEINDKTIILK